MKKRAIILIIIVVLVAAGGYFLYYKLMSGETENLLGTAKTIETNFDTKIFSDEKFGGLKQFVALPIEVGQKGKINPFMKF
ncbi:hypothetical protein KKD80_02985 [Patescibacteria group bacterium]|nr:hypothetical protein [Patescibacteria group bacterium]